MKLTVVIITSELKIICLVLLLDQQKDPTLEDESVKFDVNLKTSSDGTLEEHIGLLAIPQFYRNTDSPMGDTNSNNHLN